MSLRTHCLVLDVSLDLKITIKSSFFISDFQELGTKPDKSENFLVTLDKYLDAGINHLS